MNQSTCDIYRTAQVTYLPSHTPHPPIKRWTTFVIDILSVSNDELCVQYDTKCIHVEVMWGVSWLFLLTGHLYLRVRWCYSNFIYGSPPFIDQIDFFNCVALIKLWWNINKNHYKQNQTFHESMIVIGSARLSIPLQKVYTSAPNLCLLLSVEYFINFENVIQSNLFPKSHKHHFPQNWPQIIVSKIYYLGPDL